jgi:electron transport complex protein RnfE
MMGVGFTLALMLLGSVREIIGSGTLFQGASLMLGNSLGFLELTLIPDDRGFLLAILPPGGFVVLGLILAGKRVLDRRLERRSLKAQNVPA